MTILYILIGLGGGVLAGMFGIGGGVVVVPALLLLAKMSPLSATGTSLGALVLPVGVLGAMAYYRDGHLDLRAAVLIALGLFAGTWFGARLAMLLPAEQLKRAFAVFLVLVAIRVWTAK